MDIVLNQATIKGLPRGLHEGTVVDLKPINYLFGANGSGKSLSLRCITNQAKNKIREKDLTKLGYFAQYITATPQQNFYQDQFQILDRKASDIDLESGDIQGQVFYQHLEEYPEVTIKVRDALQKYLGRYPNVVRRGIYIAMNFLREEEGVPGYSPQQESDGLKRLSLLLSYIYHPKCKFLAIDEPELFLHPDMVAFLLDEILAEIKNGKQFALVTHSPEIIKIGSGEIYSYIYFNLKNTLAETHIIQASKVEAMPIIEALGYLLDVNRRAFLYAPITIFVEGLHDEVIYNKLKEIGKVTWNRRIFMVNTGGISSMFNFWKLWNLFDKDSRVIMDNPANNKEKDSVLVSINDFCKEFKIDENLSLEEKIKLLEVHKIFVAPYPDVLHFGDKCIEARDCDGAINNLDYSLHVSTLQKALKVEEPKVKQLRKEEKEWLFSLAQEIFKESLDNGGTNEIYTKIKNNLEQKHPNIQIEINSAEGYPMSIYFQVSKNRKIFIKLAKETMEKSLFGVE